MNTKPNGEIDDKYVYTYTIHDPLTNSPMKLYKWKHCRAIVYEGKKLGKKWATVAMIETAPEFRNQGEATELMLFLKKYYKLQKATFGGTVALNPAMQAVYEKTGVKQYTDDNVVV